MENGREITKIARIARLYAARGLKQWGITPAEYDCLRQIRKKPGVSQKAVAETLGIDKAAVARQTAKLEEKGYLRRTKSPEDGREKLLYPTERAQQIKQTELSGEAAFYRWLLGSLSEEERRAFAGLLGRLYPAAKAERKQNFCHVEGGGSDETR